MTRKTPDVDVFTHRRVFNGRSQKPERTLLAAYLLLKHHRAWAGVLGHDLFGHRIVKHTAPPYDGAVPGEWTSTDTARTRVWLSSEYATDFGTDTVDQAVLLLADDAQYHPVRDYLTAQRWDGQSRATDWLHQYLGAAAGHDPESVARRYVQRVGLMWLVSAVARVMRPGCKADHVLILEGQQGLGKSSALGILAGDEWFLDTPLNLQDKDSVSQIHGCWIVELAELDALSKVEATVAKAFFSRRSDKVRAAYTRHAERTERQCVFCGTTNTYEYLRDATGNRRYWPIRCKRFERERLIADRDQIWAEALHWFREGLEWWPQADDFELLAAQQALRETVDPWVEQIAYALTEEAYAHSDELTMRQLLDIVKVEPGRQDERSMAIRVGRAMHALGWERREVTSRAQRRISRFIYVRPGSDLTDTSGAS